MSNQDNKLDEEAEKRRWKNRRRMAWLALMSMIIVFVVLLFGPISESRIEVLSDPITWFFFGCVSITGAYMGLATWAEWRR